jgi:lysophospholipase L1-like esterase
MKSIVLIGDSIRMGYQETVRAELAGVADLWWPEVNGGHTVNVLMHLHLWVGHRKPDIVHVNAGLHDIRTLWYGGRVNMVPVGHYRENVRAILTTARDVFGAVVAWATTTPVREELHHRAHARWNDFDRFEADVRAYNDAALEVCADLGVPVNDLHRVAAEAGLERIQTEDGVHYNPEGSAVLGRAVAGFLRREFLGR